MVAAPQSASATHWDRSDRAARWGHVHKVRHTVYRPRYHHVYVNYDYADPYAYRYTPRGYYPYYNSNYWGAPRIKRFRGHLPPYYGAWGAPRRDYHHVEWHKRHYGGHRRGDW
ncbi:MAG TPA: hypothetical protein PLD46_02050 [Hyphomicrobium sp.]|nr:hypothetical protein [Hyphomicrobium sp.]